MRAGYFEAVGKAVFRDDMPEPQLVNDTDVKIKVHCCGICGSEIHAYHGVHPFRIPPIISGHEFAGEVVEVGSAVTQTSLGQRVTAEPQYGCGCCWYCRNGLYNVCTSKSVLGARGWSGSLGEYVVVPEKTVVRLNDSLTYEDGALIEPIANGMYASRNTPITSESTVLIIGAGPIGIGDFLCVSLYKPKHIILADIVDFNLQRAGEMGCENTVNSKKSDLRERVMQLTGGLGADVTFLAWGDGPSIQQAAELTRGCGKIVMHAMISDGLPFPYQVNQQREQEFKAYNMYRYEDFALVAKAIDEGHMDLSRFISHRYPIESFSEAIYMADKRPEPVLKVMMHF